MRFFACALLLLLAASPAAGDLKFSGAVGAEVDIFRETYRSGDLFEYLSDPDAYEQRYTTSIIESNDTRTSGLLELGLDLTGPVTLGVRNEYSHGPELLRDGLDAGLTFRVAPRRTLRLEDKFDLRRNVGGSLSYDQDLQHSAVAEFRADSLAGRWTLKLREEIADSRVRDDSLGRAFDYDRNRLSASLERRMRGGQWGFEGSLVHKETPSGVTGTYREPRLRAFIRRRSGFAWYWEAEGESRRRTYFDASLTGAGSWMHEVRGVWGFDATGGWGIELNDDATVARYDRPDEVYIDYAQNRTELRGRVDLTDRLTAEAVPAFEFLRGESGQRYRQFSAEAGFSLDAERGGWIHVSEELGRRIYSGGADSMLAISFGGLDVSLGSSDYLFTTTTLMGRMGLGAGLFLESFFDYTLEKHDGGDGNFSLLSCTASLTRRF